MTQPPFSHHHEPKPRRPILTAMRNNFIAGLVVIAPIGLTLWLIWTVVGWVDSVVWPFVPVRISLNSW